MNFKSVVYFKHSFCGTWGMKIPSGNFAQFHVVVRGQCRLELASGTHKQLNGGDVVIFPHGTPHRLLTEKDSPCLSGREVVTSIMSGQSVFDQGEMNTMLICGHYELDSSFQHPFFASLPDYILINGFDSEYQEWMRFLLDMIIRESGSSVPGGSTVATKLAEVLFIKVLRHRMLAQEDTKPSFLHALNEPIVAAALGLMHEKPAENWTVDRLALQVGASRTSFANKFKSVVGEPPMKYLTQWRMNKAKDLLKQSEASIISISEAVGYQSEASFIRAFKQYCQTTPANFRRSK